MRPLHIFQFLLIHLFIFGLEASSRSHAIVTLDRRTRQFSIEVTRNDRPHLPNNWVAKADFRDDIASTGWTHLYLETNSNFSDSDQAYAAGVAEGNLTSYLIRMHWNNTVAGYCKGEKDYCQRLKKFLTTNLDYMNSHVQAHRQDNVYWHQIGLILEQLAGLEDGFKNSLSGPRRNIDVMGLMLFNIFGDMEDLEVVLNRTSQKRMLGSGSCSALIKLLPGNKDLYTSQVTWNNYNSMLRILKKYRFPFGVLSSSEVKIVGNTAAFSSYPGTLFSGDDFYVLSSGLSTLETTIGNSNSSLWKYVTPESVLEWMRTLVANRLSRSGKEWVYWFKQQNSGTYNNQWMIVDYKKFCKTCPLSDGLLWVLEQLPGYIESADMTRLLKTQGYWPSYNTPYFQTVFNMSGGQENVKKHGKMFSYDDTPRAKIFKRDQGNVVDVNSMMRLMRYNDYKHDPFARCNCTPPYSAENGISARSDLNPANGTYPLPYLGHRSHGSTDMKLTTSLLFEDLRLIAIAGPTYESLPPFQWSKADFGATTPHEGHPDLWKFDPIIADWNF